jgi:thiol-disulfide isomerase/thioredoxin
MEMGRRRIRTPMMEGCMDRKRAKRAEESHEEEGRVITLGWQVVVLPVAAAAVVAVGFFLGRTWGGAGSAGSVQPTAEVQVQPGSGPAANPGGSGPVTSPDGRTVIQLPTSQPGADMQAAAPFAEGTVVDLPVPNHPLLDQPAPDFTMTLLSTGEEVSLSDYAGQSVMINFWSTWCPPCRFEMPWVQQAADGHADEQFVVLAVDAGERVPPSMVEDTIRQYVDSMGLTFPVLWGDNTFQVQREWTVMGLPATFFVAPDGTVVDLHQGMFPNQATLEDRVVRLLAGE